jgi:hypothetical protein
MNELLALFPILFLVYIFQCIASSPPNCRVFLVNSHLRGRLLRFCWQLGPSQNLVFLLNPFVTSSGAVIVDEPPFLVRRGTKSEPIVLDSLRSAHNSETHSVTFETPHEFTSEQTRVYVDGSPFFSVRSEVAATQFASFLNGLQASLPKRRASLLTKQFQHMFSIRAIDRRLAEYSRYTESIHVACFCLLLFVFLLMPILIFYRGLNLLWPFLLFYIVLSCGLILWLYRRSHRRLYPMRGGGDLAHLIGIAFSPFAAIRANDSLLADLMAGFHPVAVAFRILPKEEFLKFAGSQVRQAKYLFSDSTILQYLTEFLLQESIDVDRMLAPPLPENGRSVSFCPVCLTQYTISVGACMDCNQLALRKFSTNCPGPNEPG